MSATKKRKKSRFDNKNILIVGGAGFVGSNLVQMILADSKNSRIVIVDNLLSAEKINIPQNPRVKFIKGSITDNKILKQIDDTFDYVFHLATYHGNQSSIHDPLADHANNTLTTLKLYEHIKNFKKIKKVVYTSAGCSVAKKTFGKAKATTEDDPIELSQDSPYSISKIIGEFYSVYYHKQHGLPTVRARFQNVYGPGEILGAGKWRGTPATIWRNVTPTFIYRALKGMPLELHNHGDATRDFIFVEDICKGLIACSLQGKAGDVYNLASGRETTIRDLAKKIIQYAGGNSSIKFLPKRVWDTSGKRFGSTRKAKKELGFEAKTQFEKGLQKTIDWTAKNLKMIEKVVARHKDKL